MVLALLSVKRLKQKCVKYFQETILQKQNYNLPANEFTSGKLGKLRTEIFFGSIKCSNMF